MPINPNEELTPETSQEAFTARTYDPMQPVPEEAETNMEAYIKYLYDKTQRLPEKPDTREEYFMMIAGQNIGPGSDVEPLRVTENGTYSEAGKAYSPVTVNVPLPTNANERKSVTSYPVTDSANYPLPKCDVTVTDADKCEVIVTTDNTITEDSGVYIERQSGGGNRELDEIVGGSVVWNQLIQNGNFTSTEGWSAYQGSLSASNNKLTFTATVQSIYQSAGCSVSLKTNHKYIYSGYITLSEDETIAIGDGYSVYNTKILTASTRTLYIGIFAPSFDGNRFQFYLGRVDGLAVDSTAVIEWVNLIDLTALFGSTIADYVYSLEQATAGSGIAWLKSYGFLTEDYYAYQSGRLESVSVSRHVMKDSNDSVIGSYAINPITLRGIPKLNASNQLYYDGDRYEASGRVTRKYGVVDLGSLAWGYTNGRFITDNYITDIKSPSSNFVAANILTDRYLTSTANNTESAENDKIVAINRYSNICIRDSAYTDAATFKTAMSGVYLVYEKATPTYEDSSPFEANQIVDANGTEEYIDAGVEAGTRDVAIPVGHETKYYHGKAYVKPLTAGTSDTISMADMGIMPTSPMYISANGTVDAEYWKSNQA